MPGAARSLASSSLRERAGTNWQVRNTLPASYSGWSFGQLKVQPLAFTTAAHGSARTRGWKRTRCSKICPSSREILMEVPPPRKHQSSLSRRRAAC
jgi:hypothetical protein